MAEAPQGAKRLELRKYPNRRYYDATRSRHVTLEEIYALIREGYEVEVVDSKSGQDITPKVLAQIIIELDPPKLSVFPVALLHRLLRSNEQLVNDFVQRYFNQALTAFLDSQRSAEHYLRETMGLQSPAPTVADWTKIIWGPFNPSLWGGKGGQTPPPPPAAAGPPAATQAPNNHDLHHVVDELRGQVADLQEQLRRKRKKSPRRAK